VFWHPRRDTLAVAAEDYKVHMLDVPARREVMTLEGFRNGGIFAGFNHAGDIMVTIEWYWTARFWDLRTGRELLQAPESYGLTFSEDDRTLAYYASDVRGASIRHTSEIADRRALRVLSRDPSHGPGIFKDCAFSPHLPVLAAAMNDGFGLWELRTGEPLAVRDWAKGANGVQFEESGALLVHGLQGVTRWPVREDPASPGVWRFGPPQALVPAMSREPWKFSASRDGSVVARSENPAATVWHRDRPGEPIRLVPHRDARYVEVSPDGQWVATNGHGDSKVKLWSSDSGRLVKDFPGDPSSFRFSPDGRLAATGGDRLRLWEVGTWEQKPTPGPGGDEFNVVAFSPDGRLIVNGAGCRVSLVEAATGREVARLEGPSGECLGSVVFSPDGTLLAGVADFRSIHLWDLRAVRRELAAIGLDWDLPPYLPAPETAAGPIKIEFDPGPTGTAGGR
jgi:WD40 repeat protein